MGAKLDIAKFVQRLCL